MIQGKVPIARLYEKQSARTGATYFVGRLGMGGKFATVTNLSPSVLYALAAPSTPEPEAEATAQADRRTKRDRAG